jgi:hypothetical protein
MEVNPVQGQEFIDRQTICCCHGLASVTLLDSVFLASPARITGFAGTSSHLSVYCWMYSHNYLRRLCSAWLSCLGDWKLC